MYYKQIEQLKNRILQLEEPEKILLFGSYATGTASEDSDVDLLVIARLGLPRREREVRLTRRLFGCGVPYDLIVLTPEEVEQRLSGEAPFLRQILSTAKVLYERA